MNWLIAAWFAVPAPIIEAVEQMESGGHWDVQSPSGCVGLMQIHPQWSKVPKLLLWAPPLNRAEGARILAYWHAKSGGNWPRALAAYNCGWGGLSGRCGAGYAAAVMRALPPATRGTQPTATRKRQHHLPPLRFWRR